MRDGRTRRDVEAALGERPASEFASKWQATLVVVEGDEAGMDYALERESTVLGRGPGVDLAFDDDTMSRAHAAVEFAGDGLRVRDLGSLNGVRLNGGAIQTADLEHGDRVQVGEHVFQLVLEERKHTPRTWVLSDS